MKPQGLVSVIVPCRDGLSYTRRCLESVRRFSTRPYELVLIDDGSRRAAREYLKSLSGVRLIRHAASRGFPRAINRGLRAARGELLVWLNTDVVVGPGWLELLAERLEGDPRAGAAVPTSDDPSGPREQYARGGGAAASWPRLAAARGLWRRGETATTPWAFGYCVMLKRRVVQEVGLLDERFGLGYKEDNDYSLRIWLAGYKILLAKDVFVHHDGGRTFRAAFGARRRRALRRDARRTFDAKWRARGIPLEMFAPGGIVRGGRARATLETLYRAHQYFYGDSF